MDLRLERQSEKTSKYVEVVDFIDTNMQVATKLSYDHDKTLDENLEDYKLRKALQDEADQINFLR